MPPEGIAFTTNQDSGSDDVHDKLMDIIDPQEETTETEESTEETTETGETTEETTETEETSETEESTEDDETTEDETETSEEAEDDEGPTLEASEFAQLLGIDENALIVEEDGSVSLQTKIDGEVGKVSMSDLIKSYQTDAHVTQKSQKVAEERRVFEQTVAQQAEVLKAQITEITAVSKALETQLTREFNSINWDQLRIENPAEWTAKRQEFTDRVNNITNAKKRAASVIAQNIQERNGKSVTERNIRLQGEAELLRTALPEWNDPEVAAKHRDSISKFIVDTYGFGDGDTDKVEDHRLILLAVDAQKYRESQKTSKATKKMLKTLPKLQKPGGGRRGGKSAVKKAAQSKQRIRLKKSGSTKDLAAFLESKM